MTDDLDPRTDPGTTTDDTARTTVVPAAEAVMPPSPAAQAPAPYASPATPTAPLTPAARPDSGTTVRENDVAWSTAAPVVVGGSSKPPRRGGRLRWAAAIAVVAVVIAASAAAAALLTGGSATSTVLGYVPAQTIVYGEVRLDLPGDQKSAVGAFLSKFPGFADQSALDSKLDEVLDDLVRGASNGEQTYTGDIKAWFDGDLAFSLGPLPPASSLTTGDTSAMSSFRALALLSVKDPTAAAAWFDAAFKKAGASPTMESYGGTTVTVFPETSGVTTAYALIDGKVAVFGDLTSVKAAIDTNGNSGFASEPGPKAALGSSSGDHVGFMYVALRPLLDWSAEASKAMPAPSGGAVGPEIGDAMLKIVPDWAAYWLSFEDDAIVAEATTPKADTVLGPTENRTSSLAQHIPASAIVASIAHDYGTTLSQALDLYRSDATLKPMLDQLDQVLGLVGGAKSALGWVGDTAIVINDADGTPEAGLIIAPSDSAAADRLLTSLKTFISLGGAQQGITIHEETYNGTTITIVDVGDLGSLAGASGALPPGVTLPSGQVEIAVAVTGDVVVIGSGPAFVKHVLDTTSATSLASTDGYKQLADRAGPGTGATYVDIGTIREMIEKAMAASDPTGYARYQTDVQPFLKPFDAMFVGTSISGDLAKSIAIVTVK
jgi:hypothetical protein